MPLGVQFLGEEVDLLIRLIGSDKHILPDLADLLHRNRLMLRVCHGDEVRVGIRHDLPAGRTAQAGTVLSRTHHSRRQKSGQGMLAGAFRAAYQIEMRHPAPTDAGTQILFDSPVAQKSFKPHTVLPLQT